MRTQIFAHRGYPIRFPENSLASFKYSIDHHADGLEFDVHLTRDNVPVVMHDERIDRTTDGSGLIRDYTYAQLCRYHLSNGETIPLLRDLLRLVGSHDIYLNLEFKTNRIHYHKIEKIVFRVVSHYRAQLAHPVIYSSFNLPTLQLAQKIAPDNLYYYLTGDPVKNPKTFIKQHRLNGLHPGYYISGIEPLERIYTVDDPREMKKLFKKRVLGIFTDNFVLAQKLRNQIQA